MKGVIINNGEKVYIMYLIQGEESDEVDYKKIEIYDSKEFLDIPSGEIVEFSVHKGELHNGISYEYAFIDVIKYLNR